MKTLTCSPPRRAARRRAHDSARLVVVAGAARGPRALAGDVYSNIGPAPQLPAGGLVGRYPIANYQLDQYFPAISVGLTSGVDVSGVAPMIAYFARAGHLAADRVLRERRDHPLRVRVQPRPAQRERQPRLRGADADLEAIHNLYTSTFGAPWLVVAIVLAGCWAMWKALVQRRYTETAGALAVSLLYCVLAIGIVTQPQRTIAPASKLSNELSTALLSLTSQGSVSSEQQAKSAA